MFFSDPDSALGSFFLGFIGGGINVVKQRCLTDGLELDVLHLHDWEWEGASTGLGLPPSHCIVYRTIADPSQPWYAEVFFFFYLIFCWLPSWLGWLVFKFCSQPVFTWYLISFPLTFAWLTWTLEDSPLAWMDTLDMPFKCSDHVFICLLAFFSFWALQIFNDSRFGCTLTTSRWRLQECFLLLYFFFITRVFFPTFFFPVETLWRAGSSCIPLFLLLRLCSFQASVFGCCRPGGPSTTLMCFCSPMASAMEAGWWTWLTPGQGITVRGNVLNTTA